MAQRQARAKAVQVCLDVVAAARGAEAPANALQHGIAGIGETVVDPAAFAALLDQPGVLQDFEIAADVGLGFRERVHELANTQAVVSRGQETTREPETAAFAERGEHRVGCLS